MTNTSPISFKSRINIVTNKVFAELPAGHYIDFLLENPKKPNIVTSDMFYTLDIRTCTGGGLKNSSDNAAAGFHLWDEKLNAKNLSDFINQLKDYVKNPEGGLLIGSKKITGSPNSVPLFKLVKKELSKICSNISYFQTIKKPYGEADFKYSLADDTWNILLTDNIKCANSVRTINKLQEFFEDISIAPSDRLFVNGKEITKREAPHIFRNV